MANPLYKIIKFPLSDTKNGSLAMFQTAGPANKKVPFPIRRVLTMTGMKGNDRRGGHAHYKTKQVVIALCGGCTLDLTNGKRKTSVRLAKSNEGLLLYPYIWHVLRNFEPKTILLVIADTKYNEKEYIRNYEKFLKVHTKRA